MASPFSVALHAVDATLQTLLGERVEIRPRAPALRLAARADDATRPVRIARAVVSERLPDPIEGDEARRGGAEILGAVSYWAAETHMWFPARAYAAIGYPVRAGDAVALLDRPGMPVVAVSGVVMSDHGDVRLFVTREASP